MHDLRFFANQGRLLRRPAIPEASRRGRPGKTGEGGTQDSPYALLARLARSQEIYRATLEAFRV